MRFRQPLPVGHTGFEPVTSALSRRHSEPTELMTRIIYERTIRPAAANALKSIIWPMAQLSHKITILFLFHNNHSYLIAFSMSSISIG